jgi:hypothetical protein
MSPRLNTLRLAVTLVALFLLATGWARAQFPYSD